MTRLSFYTPEKLSARRSRTPEGFLLIEGVPLARTGEMIYGPDEVPIPGGPDGLVRVQRMAEDVFRPETIASIAGKAVVDDHPPIDVDPENWHELALGVILNPRRGEGVEDDFLLGDVLITAKRGIDLVESGKVEVSCGYDADYMLDDARGPGYGFQRNIIYNHLALVDKGRCGPRCAIGDRKRTKESTDMRTLDKDRSSPFAKFADRLRKAIKNKTLDEDMLEETLGDAEAELERKEPTFEIHNHHHVGDEEEEEEKKAKDKIHDAVKDAMSPIVDAINDRMGKMEDSIKKLGARDKEEEEEETKDNEKILGHLELEAPPGTNDRAMLVKVKDSAVIVDSFQETAALAEIIAPGIKIPTFDSRLSPSKGLDTICNLRRTALDIAYHRDPDTRAMIDEAGAQQYKTLDCGQLRPAFMAVAALKKRANNGSGRVGDARDFQSRPSGGGTGVVGKVRSISELNKRLQAKYAGEQK